MNSDEARNALERIDGVFVMPDDIDILLEVLQEHGLVQEG